MLINKEAIPLVEMEGMNEVHFEDVEIINKLSDLIDEYEKNENKELYGLINEQYDNWYEHTVNHFQNEETMMIEKNFFAYPMHKGEHDNVLYEMKNVQELWKEQRDINILKQYIQIDLPEWLVNHISSMDMVTAHFLVTGMTPCHAS